MDKNPNDEKQSLPLLPQRIIGALADEIARTVIKRLPHLLPTANRTRKPKKKAAKKIEYGVFLDTSAIIDGRIFDIINLEFVVGTIVVLESILMELKHIADAQDSVRRERGRKGLERLEKLKKTKGLRVLVLPDEPKVEGKKAPEVDERLIQAAKKHKGRVITCDYNLEKKAAIQGVAAINVNALANALKVTAVPGEALHIKIQHHGKDVTQGIGYLDDGTMIVVENGSDDTGKSLDVVVARVIQTATGRILFAKKL